MASGPSMKHPAIRRKDFGNSVEPQCDGGTVDVDFNLAPPVSQPTPTSHSPEMWHAIPEESHGDFEQPSTQNTFPSLLSMLNVFGQK